ncbi:hypothetical protein NDU88_011351 [Pleurodeles waltl]|uniref:Uncharacterized protein n=1 Tax=Pleurodeles waltl TaxID=8319 RepID=A0AAV7QYX4_PLEWA|nr:hypothetical protein NDU88_011351 [Pleurodeles waltl]
MGSSGSLGEQQPGTTDAAVESAALRWKVPAAHGGVEDCDSRGHQDNDALIETAIDPFGQLWRSGAAVSDRRYAQCVS